MTNPTDTTPPQGGCPVSSCMKSFNFCFWAKLLVAIPALPVIAVLGMTPFSNPVAQVVGGAVAVGLAVFLAVSIDRMPALQRKVIEKKK